ncbi:MAG: T9SS type A sorting domain-containing protein [Agriterribacter sp.]
MPAYRLVSFSFLIILFSFSIFLSTNAQTMQSTARSVYTALYSNVGGFIESVPNDYASNPSRKYPLLIAFAGSGELGDGTRGVLEKVQNVGIGKMLKLKTFPASFTYGGVSYSFIVICPQMKAAADWQPSIQAIIDYAKSHYRVDDKRVYLTGLSLGGVGTFSYTSASVWRGQSIAAAVLATPGTGANAYQLNCITQSKIPYWVTNNADDPINPASQSTSLVNAINTTKPASKALLTIFPAAGKGHDCWTQTYNPSFTQNGLNVYQWMLSKVRTTVPPPVVKANAGPDQTISLPATSVRLDASKSSVTKGSIISYTWTKFSGPSGGILSLLSKGLQANLTSLVTGKYVYQLVVKTGGGDCAVDWVTINVNATASTNPPSANAGSNQTITLPTNTTTLDGSASAASSGNTIKSYLWSKSTSSPSGGAIATPASARTTINNLTAGTYTYNLLVTDSRGASKSASVVVTVKQATASTDPPTANAGKGETVTLPVSAVTLDGSYSKASAGNTIVAYKWTKGPSSPAGGNITSPTSVKTTITNLVAGTYTYSLLVTDNRGATRSGGTTIIVHEAVQTTAPPTANAGYGGIITLPTNSISLNGFLSKAAKGNTITSYAWSKYSGPSAYKIVSSNAMQTKVTSLVAGVYFFTLKVTDNRGSTASARVQVTVKKSASGRTSDVAGDVSTEDVSFNPETNELLSSEFDVSPGQNPVQSDLNLKLSGTTAGKASILMYNTAGQLQLQQEFRKDEGMVSKAINISRLPPGIYIVHIMMDEKHRKVLRIVKQP